MEIIAFQVTAVTKESYWKELSFVVESDILEFTFIQIQDKIILFQSIAMSSFIVIQTYIKY